METSVTSLLMVTVLVWFFSSSASGIVQVTLVAPVTTQRPDRALSLSARLSTVASAVMLASPAPDTAVTLAAEVARLLPRSVSTPLGSSRMVSTVAVKLWLLCWMQVTEKVSCGIADAVAVRLWFWIVAGLVPVTVGPAVVGTTELTVQSFWDGRLRVTLTSVLAGCVGPLFTTVPFTLTSKATPTVAVGSAAVTAVTGCGSNWLPHTIWPATGGLVRAYGVLLLSTTPALRTRVRGLMPGAMHLKLWRANTPLPNSPGSFRFPSVTTIGHTPFTLSNGPAKFCGAEPVPTARNWKMLGLKGGTNETTPWTIAGLNRIW